MFKFENNALKLQVTPFRDETFERFFEILKKPFISDLKMNRMSINV